MRKSEGGFMSVSAIIFVVGFVLCIGAILIYLKAEDTPFHKTLEQINSLSGDFKQMRTDLNEFKKWSKTQIEGQNKKIQEAGVEMGKMMMVNGDTAKQCEDAQDHCARLREGQIQIQEAIAMKRPVTKIEGPIIVEIMTSKKRYTGRATVGKKTTTRKAAEKKTTSKKTVRRKPLSAKQKIMMQEAARKKKATEKKTKKKATKETRSSSSITEPKPPVMAMGRQPLGRGLGSLLS